MSICSKNITKAFEDSWINKFGAPSKFLSDQGRQYIASEFKNLLKSYKIKHVLSSPYNPTCNSISERINSTILQVCRLNRGKSLPVLKKAIEIRLNLSPNTRYKLSPYEIVFGKSI
ncbi:Gag-Pro-Pol polyprotein [Dictyocoela roeselum]|nr:Gag-Pro-Pol polyprotein [Dictyocoela roeselum]